MPSNHRGATDEGRKKLLIVAALVAAGSVGGRVTISPSSCALRGHTAQTGGRGRDPEFSRHVQVDGGGMRLASSGVSHAAAPLTVGGDPDCSPLPAVLRLGELPVH